jgi:hypothetical protein
MTKSEKKVIELHNCIVCARTFNILAVYNLDGNLVECIGTSPEGHCVPDEQRPLVACDTHTAEEIKIAYKKWKSREAEESVKEQDDEKKRTIGKGWISNAG